MPPSPDGDGARLTGPVIVLSPKAVDGPLSFSAELQTPRPGPAKRDSLQLLFGYLNMHQYYAVCLQRDGTLTLRKRTGEGSGDLLASATVEDARPSYWNRFEVACTDGTIEVRLNGAPALAASDPEPYRNGRCGFDVPLHVGSARVRAVRRA